VPTLHREGGFEFIFRARDGTEPPHVHVYGNDGYAKVWLAPEVKFARVRRYDVAEKSAIIRITEEHRDDWLAKWNRFFGRQ
jgi:hypothetical protein